MFEHLQEFICSFLGCVWLKLVNWLSICRNGPLNIVQLHIELLSCGIAQAIVIWMRGQTFGLLVALYMPSCKRFLVLFLYHMFLVVNLRFHITIQTTSLPGLYCMSLGVVCLTFDFTLQFRPHLSYALSFLKTCTLPCKNDFSEL